MWLTFKYFRKFKCRKKVLKIIDLLGREINLSKTNNTLIYIYDDGSVEKKIIIK